MCNPLVLIKEEKKGSIMIEMKKAKASLKSDEKQAFLKSIYAEQSLEDIWARYEFVLDQFEKQFGTHQSIGIFSAPGRSEIGGNHTDHQGGNVVSASINLDVIGVAAPNESMVVRLESHGHDLYKVDISNAEIQQEEINTTAALIRGMAAKMIEMGYPITGFDAFVTSDVLPGSGLSSSASFEIWVGVAMNELFCNGEISPEELAKIAQYAENVYFGKPSGLQDQMASSVGGIVAIDFADTEAPAIRRMTADFHDYALCIIDSGADHADLTDEYAAIPRDMGQIAAYFQKEKMCQVAKEQFMEALPLLRKRFGDRAVLRGIHFLQETERAKDEADALMRNDMNAFLQLVRESGASSYMYLQNIYPAGAIDHQDVGIALAICDDLLEGEGAFRVHGGGFAGTVQAFVPKHRLERFKKETEKRLGEGCCHVLAIRPIGGTAIL